MIKECALNNQEHILFHSRFATALRVMIIIIVIQIHLSAMEMNWLNKLLNRTEISNWQCMWLMYNKSIHNITLHANVSKIVAIEILVLISYYHVI